MNAIGCQSELAVDARKDARLYCVQSSSGCCEAVTAIGDEALFAGLHARWASPRRRGNSMNVRSSKSAIVSAQITASIGPEPFGWFLAERFLNGRGRTDR